MTKLVINTIAQAFTKTAKSENGEVLREAIGKFDFGINLEFDLATPKMQQIITYLIIDTIKVAYRIKIETSFGTKQLLPKSLRNTPQNSQKIVYMNWFASIVTMFLA